MHGSSWTTGQADQNLLRQLIDTGCFASLAMTGRWGDCCATLTRTGLHVKVKPFFVLIVSGCTCCCQKMGDHAGSPLQYDNHAGTITQGRSRRDDHAGTITQGQSRRDDHAGTITQGRSRRDDHAGTITQGRSRRHNHAGTITQDRPYGWMIPVNRSAFSGPYCFDANNELRLIV